MNLLLADKLAPITSEIGFLECEIREVTTAYIDWMFPVQQQRSVTLVQTILAGDLESVLHNLLPLTSHEARRVVFVPTVNGWTAYFDNLYRGTDSTSTLAVLTKQLRCRGVRSVAIPNTIRKVGYKWKGRYGATVFQVYGPNKTEWLNCQRLLQVINDGGKWVFDNIGKPFPFENTFRYRTWPTQQKFSVELLAAYLQNFGIDAFNQDYYMPSGNTAMLVAKQGQPAEGLREYTLREARSNFE
jgi:hypothetical protein